MKQAHLNVKQTFLMFSLAPVFFFLLCEANMHVVSKMTRSIVLKIANSKSIFQTLNHGSFRNETDHLRVISCIRVTWVSPMPRPFRRLAAAPLFTQMGDVNVSEDYYTP